MKNPLITIILACLNDGNLINRCLSSIADQDYPHVELMVMDGGSEDNTVAHINSYHKHITHWESLADLGIYHAWNKALKKSSGEWIIFIGADDFLNSPETLSRAVPYLIRAKAEKIPLVYGKVNILDKHLKTIITLGKPWRMISHEFKYGMPKHFPHTGVFHHRSLFRSHGLFDLSFKIAGDYEFILRGLKENGNCALYMSELTVAGKRDGGISVTGIVPGLLEVARAQRKNKIPPYSLFWIMVFTRAICRKFIRKLKL